MKTEFDNTENEALSIARVRVSVTELRSGNLIFGQYENEEDDLKQSTICRFLGYEPFNKQIWVESDEQIEEFCEFLSIPITKDWLLNLGYFIVEDKNGVEAYRKNHRHSVKELIETDFWLYCDEQQVLTDIKYVHQLQNLYHALTGSELQIGNLTEH